MIIHSTSDSTCALSSQTGFSWGSYLCFLVCSCFPAWWAGSLCGDCFWVSKKCESLKMLRKTVVKLLCARILCQGITLNFEFIELECPVMHQQQGDKLLMWLFTQLKQVAGQCRLNLGIELQWMEIMVILMVENWCIHWCERRERVSCLVSKIQNTGLFIWHFTTQGCLMKQSCGSLILLNHKIVRMYK